MISKQKIYNFLIKKKIKIYNLIKKNLLFLKNFLIRRSIYFLITTVFVGNASFPISVSFESEISIKWVHPLKA